jgi:hypothetical protein
LFLLASYVFAGEGELTKTTIRTTGVVTMSKTLTGVTALRVVFETYPIVVASADQGFTVEAKPVNVFEVRDAKYTIETNGAIISSDGVVEVLSPAETKERFGIAASGSGFCASARAIDGSTDVAGTCALKQNDNGSYRCDSNDCTGTCTLHNVPAYCSCD